MRIIEAYHLAISLARVASDDAVLRKCVWNINELLFTGKDHGQPSYSSNQESVAIAIKKEHAFSSKNNNCFRCFSCGGGKAFVQFIVSTGRS